jgi:hypothetical protein
VRIFYLEIPTVLSNLDTYLDFFVFAQRMCNRIGVGHIRYGKPRMRKRYMTRMKMELEAYERTGNCEHLFNIANYAFLESAAPEHSEFHTDNNADSVTRGKV